MSRSNGKKIIIWSSICLLSALFFSQYSLIRSRYFYFLRQINSELIVFREHKMMREKHIIEMPKVKIQKKMGFTSPEKMPNQLQQFSHDFYFPLLAQVEFADKSIGWLVQEGSQGLNRECPNWATESNGEFRIDFLRKTEHITRLGFKSKTNYLYIETIKTDFGCTVVMYLKPGYLLKNSP